MFISELFEEILKESKEAENAKTIIEDYTANLDNFADFYIEVCNLYRKSKSDYIKVASYLQDIYNDCFVFDFFRISSSHAANNMDACQEALHQVSAKYLFAGIEDFSSCDYADVVSSLDSVLNCFELSENKYRFISMKLAEVQLQNDSLDKYKKFYEILPIVGDYAAKTVDFYNLYFKDYAFYGDLEMLPDRARYAGFMAAFLEEATEGNEENAFGLLREMIKSYKKMEKVTLKLTELYGEFVAKSK